MKESIEKGPDAKERAESIPERGSHTGIVFDLRRHGVRYPTTLSEEEKAAGGQPGQLMPEGVTATQEMVGRETERVGSFLSIQTNDIEVIGSPAGPTDASGMQRALRTADVAGQKLEEEGKGTYSHNPQPSPLLSYDTMTYFQPGNEAYPHEEVYDRVYRAAIAEGLDIHAAAQKGQDATLDAAFSSQHPNAEPMRKEAAGAFAILLLQGAGKLNTMRNGTVATIHGGSHGGVMEYILQKALVWEDADGVKHGPGFSRIEDIGGSIAASEGYRIGIQNGENGILDEIFVEFDSARRERVMMYNLRLDVQTLYEMAAFYRSLHEEIPKSGLEDIHLE